MVIPAGTRFSHFVIHSLLGTGGMGEVYLAEDTQLGRKIALKLLPENFTQDPNRLRRFEQEARTASALNHPNILTIYEIGLADPAHFIATELVEGVTLRKRIIGHQLSLGEALEIAVQTASALAAAHHAGIVHRDVKPENIMLRRDGYVKVLDFGLAKLTEHLSPSINTQAPTLTKAASTDPGTVLGTARYMSPEQARGYEVDARTDIWSLGVVIYEMVAGRAPFDGATRSDVIAAVLKMEPAPLQHYSPEAPAQLQRIVKKALMKDADERYQDVRDLRLDLKFLKRELEVEAELHASSSPEMQSILPAQSGGSRRVETQDMHPPQVTSSIEYLAGQTRHHKKAALLILSLAFLLAVGSGYGLYTIRRGSVEGALFGNRGVVRLTSHGKVKHAVISPDGQYVAYVNEEAGRQSLGIRQVAAEGGAILVPPADVQYRGLTYSQDGHNIYYVTVSGKEPQGALYRVTAPLPGAPKHILSNVGSRISMAPDDASMAFIREDPTRGESALVIVNADGIGERKLALRRSPNSFVSEGPAWSPDGSFIACSALSYTPLYHEDLVGIRVKDGMEQLISSGPWPYIRGMTWIFDGTGLLVTARAGSNNPQKNSSNEDPETQIQLWYISFPEGKTQRITNDLNRYHGLSLSRDASTLVTIRTEHNSNIWLINMENPPTAKDSRGGNTPPYRRAKQLTYGFNKYEGLNGLTFTPDGSILYVSVEKGSRDIWSINPDGSARKQVTDGPRTERSPAVSPDGRHLAFASTRAGELNIWLMDADGSEARKLTSGKLESDPCFSPDGKWVVYTAIGGDSLKPVLWKVLREGGQPVQLTDLLSAHPSVSPDGKLIALYLKNAAHAPLRLAVMPFDGGDPINSFDVPSSFDPLQQPIVRWTPDGLSLSYIETREGVSNIWKRRLDGGPPEQLTDFETDKIFWFDWSHDGKQLVLSRGNEMGDLVLIRNKV